MDGDGRIVVCDLEAGIGTVLRIEPGNADVILVVANPSAKSIEVARRAVEVATNRDIEVIALANRVRDDADLESIRAGVGDRELLVVPEDPAIARADREGLAPIDVDPDGPGVRVLIGLAERLAAHAVVR